MILCRSLCLVGEASDGKQEEVDEEQKEKNPRKRMKTKYKKDENCNENDDLGKDGIETRMRLSVERRRE